MSFIPSENTTWTEQFISNLPEKIKDEKVEFNRKSYKILIEDKFRDIETLTNKIYSTYIAYLKNLNTENSANRYYYKQDFGPEVVTCVEKLSSDLYQKFRDVYELETKLTKDSIGLETEFAPPETFHVRIYTHREFLKIQLIVTFILVKLNSQQANSINKTEMWYTTLAEKYPIVEQALIDISVDPKNPLVKISVLLDSLTEEIFQKMAPISQ